MEKTLKQPKTSSQKTQLMTRMAILTAVGAILYRIEIPIMVAHLKIDPSLIPSLVGGIMMGPIAGVIIELLKNITHLFASTTAGIGELINFLVGAALVIPTSLIYRKKSSAKTFILSAIIGTVSILLIGALCNYLLTPAFFAVMGRPNPTQAEILTYVSASFALNGLKAFVTLVPTFLMLPMIKRNSI